MNAIPFQTPLSEGQSAVQLFLALVSKAEKGYSLPGSLMTSRQKWRIFYEGYTLARRLRQYGTVRGYNRYDCGCYRDDILARPVVDGATSGKGSCDSPPCACAQYRSRGDDGTGDLDIRIGGLLNATCFRIPLLEGQSAVQPSLALVSRTEKSYSHLVSSITPRQKWRAAMGFAGLPRSSGKPPEEKDDICMCAELWWKYWVLLRKRKRRPEFERSALQGRWCMYGVGIAQVLEGMAEAKLMRRKAHHRQIWKAAPAEMRHGAIGKPIPLIEYEYRRLAKVARQKYDYDPQKGCRIGEASNPGPILSRSKIAAAIMTTGTRAGIWGKSDGNEQLKAITANVQSMATVPKQQVIGEWEAHVVLVQEAKITDRAMGELRRQMTEMGWTVVPGKPQRYTPGQFPQGGAITLNRKPGAAHQADEDADSTELYDTRRWSEIGIPINDGGDIVYFAFLWSGRDE